MKRKTRLFLEQARDSLLLGIEMFNRPVDPARVSGVLLFLDHAFEMLLKAAIIEKTGRIRSPRERKNYGFEKCLNICETQLALVDRDEAVILLNLNGFRDAATHDLVDIREGLLYGHAQSAVQIFATVLKKAFNRDLSRSLPRRVLPLSTAIPSDITAVVSQDMEAAKALLEKGKRREDEAEARLRPYLIIENNLRQREGISRVIPSTSALLKTLRKGDWKIALPMVGGLVQSTPGGIPISLHVTRRDGLPVRIDPSAPTAIAFRYVKPEDKYPYLTTDLAQRMNLGLQRVVGLVRLFSLKGNEEFHTSIRVSRTGTVQRYSEKALQVLRNAIAEEGVEALWKEARLRRQRDPIGYLGEPPAAAAARA